MTTPANRGIATFVIPDPDKRMPAVLPASALAMWLGEVPASLEAVRDLLKTYEDDEAWEMRRDEGTGADKRTRTAPKQTKADREPGLF